MIERKDYPCGCEGYFESLENGKTRLVVVVNPDCKYDADKVGKVLPFVRYEARGQQQTTNRKE